VGEDAAKRLRKFLNRALDPHRCDIVDGGDLRVRDGHRGSRIRIRAPDDCLQLFRERSESLSRTNFGEIDRP
jgi:hypothetical protein